MTSINSYVSLNERGDKQAPFFVLWRTTMPSVLIEVGFVSNTEEENFLIKEENKMKVAYAIYTAFVKYKNYVENKNYQIVDFNEVVGKKSNETIQKQENTQPKPIVEVKEKEILIEKTETIVHTNLNTDKNEVIVNNNDELIFGVQLFVNEKLLDNNDNAFKGVKGVWNYTDGSYYKYVAGKFNNFEEAVLLQKSVRASGFADAFVVAFISGKRIDINEAKILSTKR
jgi:N-acetylmuramoyl-L-alanine amidase